MESTLSSGAQSLLPRAQCVHQLLAIRLPQLRCPTASRCSFSRSQLRRARPAWPPAADLTSCGLLAISSRHDCAKEAVAAGEPLPNSAQRAHRPLHRQPRVGCDARRQGAGGHAQARRWGGRAGRRRQAAAAAAGSVCHSSAWLTCRTTRPCGPPARRGFDVFVNMVLEDVTEWEITPEGKKVGAARFCFPPALVF